MRAVLISTYELGRQPFGLATAAAWLRAAGFEVTCLDTSRDRFQDDVVAGASFVAFHLPMHTATRLALKLTPRVRAAVPGARLCAFGLYAVMNEAVLRGAGFSALLSGEVEAELVAAAAGRVASVTALDRLAWITPDRSGLPLLSRYARLQLPGGESKVAGATEASRGCKHRCRHCPIVPVYDGKFRVVPVETVLADIRQQVEAGAEHISFGDPDFFNGITHGLRVAAELHRAFPFVTWDATIKIEHLLRHADRLPELRANGCLFVTTAAESFDDRVLTKLEKGHTRADFFRALALTRAVGLAMHPTFVSFTPWTTVASFGDMCRCLDEAGLAEQVAPVQLAIRLLIPAGSRMLELEDAPAWLGEFDPEALSYRWRNPDAEVEVLCARVQETVVRATGAKLARAETFAQVAGFRPTPSASAALPFINEPWFCCAEPSAEQFAHLAG